jgi:DNA-binding CsgD family transcriptional regulator
LDDAAGVSTAIGLPPTANGARATLTAWRGQRAATEALVERIMQDFAAGSERDRLSLAHYALAILNNGVGNYAAAYEAARASAYEEQLGFPEMLLPELIEAAVRLEDTAEAERALERLTTRNAAASTSWGRGTEAYCRALLARGDSAEAFFREAIAHLDACRMLPARHRARLVFGEWLRRERRRTEAREHLQAAYDGFRAIGADGFAERSRRELLATGGNVPRRTEEAQDALTPQELQVARLAAGDASNQEIAAQLFLSPSTVGYHLSKAFRKLDINSRRQLITVLGNNYDRRPDDLPESGRGGDRAPR